MEYFIHIAVISCIYIILGMSLNLVVGYTGMISVTHAAFFGIGAYATAIFTSLLGYNFFISILVGIGVSALVSLLIGRMFKSLSGDYYVLGTLGVNYILYGIFVNWQSITRGPLGISKIPRPTLGTELSNEMFLILVLVITIGIYMLIRHISNSSFGRVLKTIREDEQASELFGYNTLRYKILVFATASALAAIAGSLFASYTRFVSPSTFTVFESVLIFSNVIIGGAGSVKGSIVGALTLVLIPEALRFVGFSSDVAAQGRQIIFGLALTLIMLYRPKGFFGEYKL